MAVVSDMRYDARVYKEAKTLLDKGYKVQIISITPEMKLKKYNHDGIDIIAIPYQFQKPKRLVDKLKKYYLNAMFFVLFFKQILSTKADLYHAHNTNTLLFAYVAAKLKGKKLIYDSHELFRDLFPAPKYTLGWIKQGIEKFIEQTFITKTNGVITVSESYSTKLAEYYPIAKPVVLQNCPHLDKVIESGGTLRRRLGIEDKIVILYQGGYYLDTRAIDKLILSMEHLSEEYILVMIGFAVRDEEQILKRLVKEHQLDDKVMFLPPVPHQELAQYTAIADVGTIPFYDNCLAMHLCTPNKVYEYLHAGIPSVSTDMPELRKIFEAYDVGELFDPHSPESIAAAIKRLTADREDLKAKKARARTAAEHTYNWEVEEKKLISLYNQVL